MPSLLLSAFLVFVLLLVHFSSRREPLKKENPLDTGLRLRYPSVGLASTMFSLTGLFGMFLGLYLVLGPAVLVGIAVGGALCLLLLRATIKPAREKTFGEFLLQCRANAHQPNDGILWNLIAVAQIGLAASELIILRELALRGFALPPRFATAAAVGVALVAYFYCLRGGYGAVFRTDGVQFFFVILMFVVLGLFAASHASDLLAQLSQAPKFDELETRMYGPLMPRSSVSVALDFLVGTAMGFGYLLVSPDTWKRVHVSLSGDSQRSFFSLVAASFLPALLIMPLYLIAPVRSAALPDPVSAMAYLARHDIVLAFVLIGMVSCFLSSFDSALLAATHLRVLGGRGAEKDDLTTYQTKLSTGFLAVVVTSLAMVFAAGNAYFFANLSMGLFAILSGVLLGTRFFSLRPRVSWLPWLALFGFTAWSVYLFTIDDIVQVATLEQLKTVPAGALLFGAFATLSLVLSTRREQGA